MSVRNLGCVAVLAVAGGALAQGGPPPATVHVDRVLTETVQAQRMVTGDLRAENRAEVASREPGLVVTMPVSAGDEVKAGQTLATLDDKRLQIGQRELQAELEVARATLKQREVVQAHRKRDHELLQKSLSRGAANDREVRDAESEMLVAEALVLQAQRQIALMEARLDLVNDRLADMTITAPFDGVIVRKRTERGQWIGEGDPVVDMVSTGTIEAWLHVPQSAYGPILDAAESIDVAVQATGVSASSSDFRIIRDIDPTARTFEVVARLENEALQLAPGMSIVGYVPTGKRIEALTVPKNAVLRNEVGPFVYVLRQMSAEGPEQVLPARVRLTFPQGDRFVVESDEIRAGDRVVVEGNERLFPTAPVNPIEIGAEAPGEATGS